MTSPDRPPAPGGTLRAPVDRSDLRTAALYGAAVLLAPLTGLTSTGVTGQGPLWPLPVSIALLLSGAASTVLRRRAPVVVLAVAGPIGLAEIVGGGQIAAYLLLFEALFEPVMHGSRRLARATTAVGVALTVTAFTAAWAAAGWGPHLWAVLMVAALVVMTPLLWGWEVRHHRTARAGAEALAAAEHALAASRADRAVEAERRRIAQDLHDVIAGHLSAVSLHTSLAASLPEAEGRDRSLRTARESAHAALRDLRSLIGVLADPEPADGGPPPGPGAVTTADGGDALPQASLSWPVLADRLRAGGEETEVHLDEAATDPERVDPSVQAAALRIAAEAVTNAVRHGRAPRALAVDVEGEELHVEVRNARAPGSVPGTGHGRAAIRDRARAVGGTATSDPDPAGPEDRWRVTAALPRRPVRHSA